MDIRKRIFDVNTDLLERINGEKVKSKYLQKEDVFLINIGEYIISDSIEIFDGLVSVHYDPDTYKIVGFTVLHVKKFLESCRPFIEREKLEKKNFLATTAYPRTVASASLLNLSV